VAGILVEGRTSMVGFDRVLDEDGCLWFGGELLGRGGLLSGVNPVDDAELELMTGSA